MNMLATLQRLRLWTARRYLAWALRAEARWNAFDLRSRYY